MLPSGTTIFQEFGDRMTRQSGCSTRESTRCGLEGLSCFFLPFFHHSPADVDLESKVSTMDLARPSSTGSVPKLTMLTSRLEQECSMEFDDVVSLRACLLPR